MLTGLLEDNCPSLRTKIVEHELLRTAGDSVVAIILHLSSPTAAPDQGSVA